MASRCSAERDVDRVYCPGCRKLYDSISVGPVTDADRRGWCEIKHIGNGAANCSHDNSDAAALRRRNIRFLQNLADAGVLIEGPTIESREIPAEGAAP